MIAEMKFADGSKQIILGITEIKVTDKDRVLFETKHKPGRPAIVDHLEAAGIAQDGEQEKTEDLPDATPESPAPKKKPSWKK